MGENGHPHVVDQSYITSWNNKQAPGFGDPATAQQFSSIYRSQLLDNNIHYYLKRDHSKMTLADLVNAMGIAGTQDLRGVEVIVEDAEVTLNGKVRHKADRRRIEDIADIEGVRHVQNNLRVHDHGHWTFL